MFSIPLNFLILFFFLVFSKEVTEKDWNYFEGGDDWKTHDEWYCHGGAQSPVNINSQFIMDRKLEMKIVQLAGQIQTEITNTGKTLKAKQNWIEINALGRHFRAKSVVFKAPSEHTINNNNYALEMQIIMEDLTVKGKFGILSLLFESSRTKTKNILLEPFAAAAVNLQTKDSWSKISMNFGLALKRELVTLPDLEFVHYAGSLTTPPCVEIIEWFIMRHPLQMSIQESEYFDQLWKDNPDFSGNLGNNRNIQPLYGRELALGKILDLEQEYLKALIKEDETERLERALLKAAENEEDNDEEAKSDSESKDESKTNEAEQQQKTEEKQPAEGEQQQQQQAEGEQKQPAEGEQKQSTEGEQQQQPAEGEQKQSTEGEQQQQPAEGEQQQQQPAEGQQQQQQPTGQEQQPAESQQQQQQPTGQEQQPAESQQQQQQPTGQEQQPAQGEQQQQPAEGEQKQPTEGEQQQQPAEGQQQQPAEGEQQQQQPSEGEQQQQTDQQQQTKGEQQQSQPAEGDQQQQQANTDQQQQQTDEQKQTAGMQRQGNNLQNQYTRQRQQLERERNERQRQGLLHSRWWPWNWFGSNNNQQNPNEIKFLRENKQKIAKQKRQLQPLNQRFAQVKSKGDFQKLISNQIVETIIDRVSENLSKEILNYNAQQYNLKTRRKHINNNKR